MSKQITFVADDDRTYSAYCTTNVDIARYRYSIRESGGITTCRFLDADGSFGDPLDFDLISKLLSFYRLRKAVHSTAAAAATNQ